MFSRLRNKCRSARSKGKKRKVLRSNNECRNTNRHSLSERLMEYAKIDTYDYWDNYDDDWICVDEMYRNLGNPAWVDSTVSQIVGDLEEWDSRGYKEKEYRQLVGITRKNIVELLADLKAYRRGL